LSSRQSSISSVSSFSSMASLSSYSSMSSMSSVSSVASLSSLSSIFAGGLPLSSAPPSSHVVTLPATPVDPSQSLAILVSALRPHLANSSSVVHSAPRVKSPETRDKIASLVEVLNEVEKVKVGGASLEDIIHLLLEKIQVFVVQDTTPGFAESFKRVKALNDLSIGMDPQLLAAAMSMAASSSSSGSSSTTKRRRDPSPPFRQREYEHRSSSYSRNNVSATNFKLTCYLCHQKGHKSPDCPNLFSSRRTIKEGYRILVPVELSSSFISSNRSYRQIIAIYRPSRLGSSLNNFSSGCSRSGELVRV
ncbi:hypothetical protein PMAYCL1PPCAC_32050, partial [Pristionchus mayeri]